MRTTTSKTLAQLTAEALKVPYDADSMEPWDVEDGEIILSDEGGIQLSIQIGESYLCLNRWIEADGTCYHLREAHGAEACLAFIRELTIGWEEKE